MADYGVGRMGGSLRDALNEAYPMTGLGTYGAYAPPTMFPPNTAGEPTGSPAVPIPRPRPPVPPMNIAPTLPGTPPNVSAPVALPPGGVNMPMNYPAAQALYQRLGQNALPNDYAARLMQLGGY